MNQNEHVAPPRTTFDNTATGNSHVGVQGIVHGDNNTYFLSPNASPEEKLTKARNCMAAMRAAPARRWIEELVTDGHTWNEICYYWALSILSERPLNDLDAHEFASLRVAFDCAGRNADDIWSAPTRAVKQFVECRRRQEQSGVTDPEKLDDAVMAYRQLPEERQNEIQSHLGLVMTGAAQDQLDAEYAERVRERRLAQHRRDRVWKFFEPVPEPPRPRVVVPPYLGTIQMLAGACGTALILCGLVPALALALIESPPFGLAMILVLGGSGTLVAGLGPRQFPAHFAASASPFTGFPRTGFQAAIEDTVRSEFRKQGWHAGAWRPTWDVQTRRICSALTREIVELYAAPPIQPGSVNWLIRWHAQETFRRWRAGELKGHGELPLAGVGFTLGAAGASLGTLLLLGAITASLGSPVALLALAIMLGTVLLAASGLDVYLVRRHRLPSEARAAKEQLAAEQMAYRQWCAVLADRPDDIEMARWLDGDKRYLLAMARNQYGLSNDAIVEHAVLTEPAHGAQRARVRRGVWRYTAYTVWLYLLTQAGVRQIRIHLDFASGVVSNQKRTTFRYDAIASAGVKEVGERVDEGLRATTVVDGGSPRRLLRQNFHLALVNGESFEVTVKKAEEPPPEQPQDDLPWLARAALGPSGVASTLKLLEEIAAEGGDRVRLARRRREAPSFAEMPPSTDGQGPNGARPADSDAKQP